VALAIVSGAFMASCVGARSDLPETAKYFSERTFMVAHIDTIALLDSPIGETLRGTPVFPQLHPTEDLSFGPRLNLEDFTSYTIAWGRSDGADEPYKHTYYSTVEPLDVRDLASGSPDREDSDRPITEINGVPVYFHAYVGTLCEPEPGILWVCEGNGKQVEEMLDRGKVEMEEGMLALMKETDWSGIVGLALQLDVLTSSASGAPEGIMETVQAGLSQLPWISGSQAGAAAGVVALAGDLDVSDGQMEIWLKLLCDDSDAAEHLKNLLDALVDVPESDFGAENLDDILDGIEIKLDGSSVSVDVTVDTEAFMGVFTSVTGGF
jgi:hypothetical protein